MCGVALSQISEQGMQSHFERPPHFTNSNFIHVLFLRFDSPMASDSGRFTEEALGGLDAECGPAPYNFVLT